MNTKNWIQFIHERFPLFSHGPMIALFLGGHFALVYSQTKLWPSLSISLFVSMFITIFFLKMRLFDEIKDFEHDKIHNPTRPLPRGLLTVKNVQNAILICLAMEIILAAMINPYSLKYALLAIGYSFLMFKEFFIGPYLRPHLTTYAVVHTIVTIPMAFFIFSALTNSYGFSNLFFYFALINWCVFNIFEFGRKTFVAIEERELIESYSKIFKPVGAVVLVILMALLANFFQWKIQTTISPFQCLWVIFLTVSGISLVLLKSIPAAKIYRGFSSLYIILFYLTFIINTLSAIAESP
jgi:4-hydroxybenzoate polyprenyltransferase